MDNFAHPYPHRIITLQSKNRHGRSGQVERLDRVLLAGTIDLLSRM
jgi:hypothetical protein